MNCIICKEKEARNNKCQMCDSCRLKKWRKDNPDKIKKYLESTKERRNASREVYYAKNRERLAENLKKKRQEEGYKEDKKEKRRNDALIRSKTRVKYPLNNKKCEKCPNKAEHRHHTTEPKEVDKFIFLCEYCHNKIHGRKNYKDLDVIQNNSAQEKKL